MLNPLFWFGCAAIGQHAWTRPYITFDGYRERQCRWCDLTERGEYVGTKSARRIRNASK